MKLLDISTRTFPDTFVMVDDEDFDLLNQWKWRPTAERPTNYAIRAFGKVNGVKKHLLMHRQILNAPRDLEVDHINGNGLDNRRANLRLCTVTQNRRNKRKSSRASTSRFIGVNWDKSKRKFKVRVYVNRHMTHVGYFATEEAAARARDEAAKKHYGEFANLNFPPPPLNPLRNLKGTP